MGAFGTVCVEGDGGKRCHRMKGPVVMLVLGNGSRGMKMSL